MNVITIQSEAFQALFEKLDEIKNSFQEEIAKKEKPLSERLLDNDQASALLKVSKRTLQSYRDKGIISFSQFGSKIYYKVEDIEAHIEKNYIRSRY